MLARNSVFRELYTKIKSDIYATMAGQTNAIFINVFHERAPHKPYGCVYEYTLGRAPLMHDLGVDKQTAWRGAVAARGCFGWFTRTPALRAARYANNDNLSGWSERRDWRKIQRIEFMLRDEGGFWVDNAKLTVYSVRRVDKRKTDNESPREKTVAKSGEIDRRVSWRYLCFGIFVGNHTT